jgi:maltose-binding protein MalE
LKGGGFSVKYGYKRILQHRQCTQTKVYPIFILHQKEFSMKSISRREMLKLSAGVAAGAVLAACTPAATTVAPTAKVEPTAVPPKKIEGTVVVMHYRHEFTEDQFAAFMAKYPSVKLEFVDGTDLTRFYAMYAAGTPPDIVRIQAPSIPQYLARKLLYDLTPYLETSSFLQRCSRKRASASWYLATGMRAVGPIASG